MLFGSIFISLFFFYQHKIQHAIFLRILKSSYIGGKYSYVNSEINLMIFHAKI